MTEQGAATTSYATNMIAALFGVITLQELGVFVGIILGLLTFGTNFYFRLKKEKRESELHEKSMSETD